MPKKIGVCVLLVLIAGSSNWATTKARGGRQNSCPKLLVLGSRGSGADPGSAGWANGMGPPGLALVQYLQGQLGYSQVSYQYNPYPAVGILPSLKHIALALGTNFWDLSADADVVAKILNGLGARTNGLGAYHSSVMRGEAQLHRQINSFTDSACAGKTKVVLTGYSQGAQVVGDVYQSLAASQTKLVAAVVLFGDPHYNPNDSSDRFGLNAKESQRWTHNQGILNHRTAFSSGSVLSFCHRSDPICQGLGQIWHRFGQHTNYTRFDEPQLAAGYIVKLLTGTGGLDEYRWPFDRHDHIPLIASQAVAFTPAWDSCNHRWCLMAALMDGGIYWVWATRIDDGPEQAGIAYTLSTYLTSPKKPSPGKTLASARIQASADAACDQPDGRWYCPIYRFSKRDIDQLLER